MQTPCPFLKICQARWIYSTVFRNMTLFPILTSACSLAFHCWHYWYYRSISLCSCYLYCIWFLLATIVSKIKSAIVNGKINLTWMFVLTNVLSIRDRVKKGLNYKFFENKHYSYVSVFRLFQMYMYKLINDWNDFCINVLFNYFVIGHYL